MQSSQIPTVGFLSCVSPNTYTGYVAAFHNLGGASPESGDRKKIKPRRSGAEVKLVAQLYLPQTQSIVVVIAARLDVVVVVVLGHFDVVVVVAVVPGRLWETEKEEAVLLVHVRLNVAVMVMPIRHAHYFFHRR